MTQKIRKILVPLDGSKNSLRGLKFALNLSKQSGSSILGLHVSSLPFFLKTPEIIGQKNKKSKEIISQATILSQKEKIPFKAVVKQSDNIGKTIVSFAETNKIDLIVIGSRGPDPVLELFLGSVANYVLNKSKIPVTIIK